MPTTRTIEGVVTGLRPLGEADVVVRLVTGETGRLEAVARGARKSRRRFAGVLELGHTLQCEVRSGRGALPTLTSATVVERIRRSREDFTKICQLAYACEIIDGLCAADLEAPRLARLLRVWIDMLESDAVLAPSARVALESKALTFAGLAPALVTCPECGDRLEGRVHWSLDAGGGVHPWCGTGIETDTEVLHRAEVLRRRPLQDTVERGDAFAWWGISDLLRHHLGRQLQSRELLSTAEQSPENQR